jgi:hypothetical protein
MDSSRTIRNLSATANGNSNDDVIGRAGGGGTGSRRPSASSAVFFQRSTSYGTEGVPRPTRSDTMQGGAAGTGVAPIRSRQSTVGTGRMVGVPDKEAGLLSGRSLFIFSEENFVRKYAKIIIEWGYPFYGTVEIGMSIRLDCAVLTALLLNISAFRHPSKVPSILSLQKTQAAL